jgi:hypothetical protein
MGTLDSSFSKPGPAGRHVFHVPKRRAASFQIAGPLAGLPVGLATPSGRVEAAQFWE